MNSKLLWLRFMVLPMLRSAVQLLRSRDSNSTGQDDEAALAVEVAIDAIEQYLNAKEEIHA